MTALAELEILALDCQATGANPVKGHLLEIGWCPVCASATCTPQMKGGETYLLQLPDNAIIPPAVQRITGITGDTGANAVPPETAWQRLVDAASRISGGGTAPACPAVIHFARFEAPFLHDLHQKHDPDRPFPFRIICSHEIAVRLLPDLPRRGIRALAGYFGHPMTELKRSADHVAATAFIWKNFVERLHTVCGVSTLDQLTAWLAAVKPSPRSKRVYPMNAAVRRRLPNAPGVYRMLRAKNGNPIYIGKAKSLRQRVNSYFRPKAPHAEHTLEMLTQARELDFTETDSALEAAILESDEIKRHSPPYNLALRRRRRGLAFLSKDLCRFSDAVKGDFRVGPLPSGKAVEALAAWGAWFRRGLRMDDTHDLDLAHAVLPFPPAYAPEDDCLREGCRIFSENYGRPLEHPCALRCLTALGARLWRVRLEAAADAVALSDHDKENAEDSNTGREESFKAHIWTPEAVAGAIENMVLHSAHLIRRSRWLCLLSESSLSWSPVDSGLDCKMLMVFEKGAVVERDHLRRGRKTPIPPGYAKSFLSRQGNIDLPTYDRLRVVTTELRRLVKEGRDIELRLGPRAALNLADVKRALLWV